ncbi:hypothetical protein F5887DRAFT_565701 [Amanita rubescens]|nr:hypothetical protein F5887DRAFT_565701 [Amanita rubescens]
MRGPRINKSGVKNWRLAHEIICQRRVPIVLVVTGLENEENGIDDWWTQNGESFMSREMYPTCVACVTAIRRMRISGGRHIFDQLYEESREKTRKAIRTGNPWQSPQWYGSRRGLRRRKRRVTRRTPRRKRRAELPLAARQKSLSNVAT